MKYIAVLFFAFLLLAGCRQQIPQPEAVSAEASVMKEITMENATVRHFVKRNNLLVECIVPSINFSNLQNGHAEARILLYVDGQLYGQYETAAFIVKNLPAGTHEIKVNIVNADNQSLSVSRFSITII